MAVGARESLIGLAVALCLWLMSVGGLRAWTRSVLARTSRDSTPSDLRESFALYAKATLPSIAMRHGVAFPCVLFVGFLVAAMVEIESTAIFGTAFLIGVIWGASEAEQVRREQQEIHTKRGLPAIGLAVAVKHGALVLGEWVGLTGIAAGSASFVAVIVNQVA